MSRPVNLSGWRELAYGWRVQRRVIGALLLREVITRFGRQNIGFLWLFVEPMLFTLVITALWTATRAVHGSDIPIVAFALTGYSSVVLWRNMPGRLIGALKSNAPLLFHKQVTIFDVYIARILLEIVAASTSFVVLGILLCAIGWLLPPEDALKVLAGWLLLAWFGAGLSICLGALSESIDLISKLWPPMSYMIFPLSGAAFIADALPERLRDIVLYLPMLHAVEFLREGYFGSVMRAHYNLEYLAICNVALTFAALILVRSLGVPSEEE